MQLPVVELIGVWVCLCVLWLLYAVGYTVQVVAVSIRMCVLMDVCVVNGC